MRIHWLAVLCLVSSSVSWAESDEARVARTRLLESLRAERYQEVLEAYADLRELAPVAPELTLVYARACYALERFGAARDALEDLLAQRPAHAQALQLLAQVEGRLHDPQHARGSLIQAARAGASVLFDLGRGEGKRVLGELLSDPSFVLAVMEASRGVEVQAVSHNPFRSPLILVGHEEPEEKDPKPSGKLEALEREIRAAFQDLARHHRSGDTAALSEGLTELRALLAGYEAQLGESALAAAERQLEAWFLDVHEAEELYLSILLQLQVQRGNRALRQMHEALEESDYAAVAGAFRDLEVLVEAMRSQPRGVFSRNADALYLRGQTLADRARTLAAIAALRLEVTGVVVPGDGEPARAIVNDRIHEEGDLVLQSDAEDSVYEDVRVLSIQPFAVRFRYAGVEFLRGLKARSR